MGTKVSASTADVCYFVFVGAFLAVLIGSTILAGVRGYYWYSACSTVLAIVTIGIHVDVVRYMVRTGEIDDQLAAMALQDARSEAALLARESMRNAVEAALEDA